ncbi:MAG TPA: hypothetical protein VFM37_11445 [Pseudonocardiaceae bacterium]|nr:hypothetical protein [Pseudonocardiaceae bacterium]
MFGLLRRRRRLPAGHRPALERDERVVAWAAAAGDRVVVATNRGLFLPDRPRLGWHEIHKVTWSGRELTVVPAAVVEEREGYRVVEDLAAVACSLPDPGDLPHQVRTRVTRSVGYTARHAVPGGSLRLAARRVTGVDGLAWTVRYDPGTDGASAAVRQATDELVAATAQAAGE